MKFKFPMRSKFVEAWEYAILNWGNGITSFFFFKNWDRECLVLFLQRKKSQITIDICEFHYYFLIGITLIKLRTIIGLPYLVARSSK
jgi:hypothetical protein